MKPIRTLFAALLPLVLSLNVSPSVCFSQEPTPTPAASSAPASPASPLYEEEAKQIALKRVPGKFVGESEFRPNPNLWIFHVLDIKGRECVVMVAEKTRGVSKVAVPRLTVNQALAIALKKVRGKRAKYGNDFSTFDSRRGEYSFYIETPKDELIQIVTVNDRTGKVVSVSSMGDAG